MLKKCCYESVIVLPGTQVLQQLQAQLGPIPEQVLTLGAEIMARRIEMLNLLRSKHRCDRATYQTVELEVSKSTRERTFE